MRTPASVAARSMNSRELVASRVALVATARTSASKPSAMPFIRWRQARPRSRACGRQNLHVAATGAEADDLAFACQGLEAIAADRAGDDEVDAVRADVDGTQGAGRVSVHVRPLRSTVSRR